MDQNMVLSAFTCSAFSVWFIQKLKASKYFPWLHEETAKLNRVVSALLAALGAAGLHWEWTASTHTLTITNLTLAVVGVGVWHWLQHFAMQEVIYRMIQQKPGAQVSGEPATSNAVKVVALIAFLMIAAPAFAQTEPFAHRALRSTAILYGQDGAGDMAMHCTATAYKKLLDGYLFVTASHCVSDQEKQEGQTSVESVKLNQEAEFLTFDDPKDKEFLKAEVVVAGLQSRGDDFAILRVRTAKDIPVIPLGDETKEDVGNRVINIASPMGLGRQTMEGYISMIRLDRPVKEDSINWEDSIVLQIGAGPESSGSSILSTTQNAIIGFLVGTVAERNVIAIPVSKFKAFTDAVSAKKYKWYPVENLPKDMPALQ